MKFLIDNFSLILFGIVLLVSFFRRLLRHEALSTDGLVALVWRSVGVSLVVTYVVAACDYWFFKSSHFGFSWNQIGVIIIPGALCIGILGISAYQEYVSKAGRRGKK